MLVPNNSNKLLNLKRERNSPKFQINDNKSKNKKLSLIKSKRLKKHSMDKNSTESYSSDNEEAMEESVQEGRQENSLCQLTKNFIQYIKSQGKEYININEIVEKLTVKKRRIYDITNVLQGIGYIQKTGKNEIHWIKGNLTKKNCLEGNYFFKKLNQLKNLKNDVDDLQKENHDLSLTLDKFREEFETISQKRDFEKYGYITFNDMSDISKNEKLDILILKSTKGSKVTIINKEDSKKACSLIKRQMDEGLMERNDKLLNYLRNEYQIFMESRDQLKIYRILNGFANEIIQNPQQKLKFSEDLLNNNSLISDSGEGSKINSKGGCFNLFNPNQGENNMYNMYGSGTLRDRNENYNNNYSNLMKQYKIGENNLVKNNYYMNGNYDINCFNKNNKNNTSYSGISTIFQRFQN